MRRRFTTPDPGNAGAEPTNPQSWNMYSYVRNNPLSFTDPTGLCADDADNGAGACGSNNTIDSNGCNIDTTECISVGSDGVIDPHIPPPGLDFSGLIMVLIQETTITLPSDGWCLMSNPMCSSQWEAMMQDIGNQMANTKAAALAQANAAPTNQQKLLALEVAGMKASHDLGCVAKAEAGMVPFVGSFMGGPNTPLSGADSGLGAVGDVGIVASQSDTVVQGLNAIEMPNIGEAVAQYGPAIENAVEKLGPLGTVVGGANAAMQANACISRGN